MPSKYIIKIKQGILWLHSRISLKVVQKLLGHADVKTTEIYTHVLQQNLSTVVSPFEALLGKGIN